MPEWAETLGTQPRPAAGWSVTLSKSLNVFVPLFPTVPLKCCCFLQSAWKIKLWSRYCLLLWISTVCPNPRWLYCKNQTPCQATVVKKHISVLCVSSCEKNRWKSLLLHFFLRHNIPWFLEPLRKECSVVSNGTIPRGRGWRGFSWEVCLLHHFLVWPGKQLTQ